MEGILIQIGGMINIKDWREGETFGTNRGRGGDSITDILPVFLSLGQDVANA